jgi:hypothetical protein
MTLEHQSNLLMKSSVCRLLKKISGADEQNGVLEYGSIGVLGFMRITPLLQHSIIPLSGTLERGD